VRRWLLVAAGIAALAIAGTSTWLALGGGGRGGAAAPAASASGPASPSGLQAQASPGASGSPATSGAPVPSGSPGVSGAPAPSGSPGLPTATPSPQAALLPLPAGVGHFTRAPLRRLVGGPRDRPVPILMYHLLGDPPAGEPYPDLFVTLHDFAAEMRYLDGHGYTAVTLHQLAEFWHGEGRLPAKPVVLSFDDGYRSDWRVAAAVLQRLGWPGVLNLCLNAVHPHGDLPAPLVRGLVGRGWEIDDHTLTHPDLTTLDAAGLHREIVVSRAILERLTGQRVSFFCYPSGAYDATVVRAVRAAGFAGATTTDDGLATRTRMYTLPRIRVHRDMTLADFAQALGA
jgi:peptidoglycan/xylan/chitin deacetylase (PgdA/CDA1 family)